MEGSPTGSCRYCCWKYCWRYCCCCCCCWGSSTCSLLRPSIMSAVSSWLGRGGDMKGAGVLRRLRAAEGTPYTGCGLLLVGEGAPSIASSPTAPCVLPSPLRLLRALPRDAPSATLSAAPTLCRSSSAARCAGGGSAGGGEATSQLSASPAVNSSYSTLGAAAMAWGCGGRLGLGSAAVGVGKAGADCAGSAAAVAPRRPGKRRRERTKAAGESTAPLPEAMGCWDIPRFLQNGAG